MDKPIVIEFTPMGLGRVEFTAEVMTADCKSLRPVMFKLDTASDFTTLSCSDLQMLGYTNEQLLACPRHVIKADTAGGDLVLRYLTNISIKFGDREIQHVRIFFTPEVNIDTATDEDFKKLRLRSLFGCDLLKYFNFSVDYDNGHIELRRAAVEPSLSDGEKRIQIYSTEKARPDPPRFSQPLRHAEIDMKTYLKKFDEYVEWIKKYETPEESHEALIRTGVLNHDGTIAERHRLHPDHTHL